MASNLNPESQNNFCKFKNLKNESDVEQFFIVPLLTKLGFLPDYTETKTSIDSKTIGKGAKKKKYIPDYICFLDKKHEKPVLIIDAKSPTEDVDDGVNDAQLYASVIRRKLKSPKPDQICFGINGRLTKVKHYDDDDTLYEISFEDFIDGNSKYENFIKQFSIDVLKKKISDSRTSSLFKFQKPPTNEAIKSLFEACHQLIWKTEKRSPSSAFYEFTKLMYVKINEDRKLREKAEIREKIDAGEPVPQESVIFRTLWIKREEEREPNPVNAILFENLRKELESLIEDKHKKRVFNKDEQIDLDPSTIKEVVNLLQHYDLYGVDEDLNGRLFETFLNATMRGEELGQFFTPRTVVKFMTEMADIRVSKDRIDRVIDACCGTGGFLIEAMAVMSKKIENNGSLSDKEKEKAIEKLKREHLWGIDAGKNPPIARIARINMLLHKDGGSSIYFADALDKELHIEDGIDGELKKDRTELKNKFNTEKIRFNVVLTNPPFSMKYEKNKPNEKRILEKYELAYETNKKGKKQLRTSLRSAVMFLERYYDLLEENGKLLTVMDESILNTDSNQVFREYIKNKFIIKAVISLPRNTFVKANASVKTSILYLRKKNSPDESQPKVFMAISNNVGHNDAGKDSPDKNDLHEILKKFLEFEKG